MRITMPNICINIAKFWPTAQKMSKLWLFEILISEAKVEVEDDIKTEVRYR